MGRPARERCARPTPTHPQPLPSREGSEEEGFAPTAVRLAGLAGALFGWTPDIFWAATPAEFGAIVAAFDSPATDPPDAGLVARLLEAFPDG